MEFRTVLVCTSHSTFWNRKCLNGMCNEKFYRFCAQCRTKVKRTIMIESFNGGRWNTPTKITIYKIHTSITIKRKWIRLKATATTKWNSLALIVSNLYFSLSSESSAINIYKNSFYFLFNESYHNGSLPRSGWSVDSTYRAVWVILW